MDIFLLRIAVVANNGSLSDTVKIEQIKMVLAEASAPPVLGIVERLVAIPKSEGGYDWVIPSITDANFPATAEPSLVGAQLDEIVGSREHVLAVLQSRGRRGGSGAETLLFGQKNPEEQRKGWIWGLGQAWVNPVDHCEYAVVLGVDSDGGRNVYLGRVATFVHGAVRVLSFPL